MDEYTFSRRNPYPYLGQTLEDSLGLENQEDLALLSGVGYAWG